MAVLFGTVGYTEFLKSKEYFRLLPLLYPKTRESKRILKRINNQGGVLVEILEEKN